MIHAIRSAITYIVQVLFAILTKTKVSGIENVPEEGGCILAMNHLSRLDPALVYIQLKRKNMTALVADKYKSYPGLNWIVNLFGGIWINREDADYQAMREARQFMNNGGLLGIAPEGTRSKTKALIRAKTGTAFLADKVCVPLVPIAVTGTENAIHLWFRLRRPNLTLQFGEPFTLPPLDRNDRSGSLRKNTDELMCRIAAMLPEEYRGVYADHPRLQELLAEGVS